MRTNRNVWIIAVLAAGLLFSLAGCPNSASDLTGTGRLAYSVGFPDTVSRAWLGLYYPEDSIYGKYLCSHA